MMISRLYIYIIINHIQLNSNCPRIQVSEILKSTQIYHNKPYLSWFLEPSAGISAEGCPAIRRVLGADACGECLASDGQVRPVLGKNLGDNPRKNRRNYSYGHLLGVSTKKTPFIECIIPFITSYN
jgi:hypothetical protein